MALALDGGHVNCPAHDQLHVAIMGLEGEAGGRWHFLTIPEEQAAAIKAEALALPRGFGSVGVEARIGGVSWRTSVFPSSQGGYLLPIKASVRKEAGLAAGDQVAVELEVM